MCNKSPHKSVHTDRNKRVCVALMVFSATTYKTIHSYIFYWLAASTRPHVALNWNLGFVQRTSLVQSNMSSFKWLSFITCLSPRWRGNPSCSCSRSSRLGPLRARAPRSLISSCFALLQEKNSNKNNKKKSNNNNNKNNNNNNYYNNNNNNNNNSFCKVPLVGLWCVFRQVR